MIRPYLIDTNTVSYILKGKSPASRAKLSALPPNVVACISAITEAELHYGVAKSPNAKTLGPLVHRFLAKIPVLPWGRDEASVYGQLRARQESDGKTLDNLDMLIAAHAIAIGATLVTNDKAFSRVPDLPATENWATDL
jgi:tRNA(fMet)-specific endonuclease VapC